MPRVVAEFLQHILDEMNCLSRKAQETDEEQFLRDETLQRSFVRSIEIIGKAVKQIPESTRHRYPRIQWREMAAMRDEIVGDMAANKSPQLISEFSKILAEERARG